MLPLNIQKVDYIERMLAPLFFNITVHLSNCICGCRKESYIQLNEFLPGDPRKPGTEANWKQWSLAGVCPNSNLRVCCFSLQYFVSEGRIQSSYLQGLFTQVFGPDSEPPEQDPTIIRDVERVVQNQPAAIAVVQTERNVIVHLHWGKEQRIASEILKVIRLAEPVLNSNPLFYVAHHHLSHIRNAEFYALGAQQTDAERWAQLLRAVAAGSFHSLTLFQSQGSLTHAYATYNMFMFSS